MNAIKRMIALLLCLSLLPVAALAEETAQAVTFDLSFQMDATAYPEADQAVLGGIADMVNLLTMGGTVIWTEGCMDMRFDVVLDGSEDTRTAFHLFGPDSHWGLESSLLGDQQVMFNMQALTEFGMKAYFHLGMPLQYLALCVSPYITRNAFEAMANAWNPVMHAAEGSRVIPREDVLALSEQLAEIAGSDRAFSYWVKALLLDLGYDDMVIEALSALPDWAEGFLGDEGITVTVAEGAETWTTGDITLFTRTVSGADDAWALTLPETADGYVGTMSFTRQGGDMALTITATAEAEGDLLNVTLAASDVPETLPCAATPTFAAELSGDMLGAAKHVRWEGSLTEDGAVTLTEKNTETGSDMLTITGTVKPVEPTFVPAYTPADITGVNILSVYEDTLAEFVSAVKEPFAAGMMPLLLHLPASSYQSIFQLLTDYGVLELLTTGQEE